MTLIHKVYPSVLWFSWSVLVVDSIKPRESFPPKTKQTKQKGELLHPQNEARTNRSRCRLRDNYLFSVSFRRAADDSYTKPTHQIKMYVLLISKPHQMIAVALRSHVSACNLNKQAQIPPQFYWSPVIISCFGTELDSWGCCLHVTLLGGNHNGKQAAGYADRVFICTAAHYQAQHLAHKSTKHTTRAGSSRASMIKEAPR